MLYRSVLPKVVPTGTYPRSRRGKHVSVVHGPCLTTGGGTDQTSSIGWTVKMPPTAITKTSPDKVADRHINIG